MLNFRYSKIEDRDWVHHIFRDSGYIGADFCFGSLYLWQEVYKCKITKDDNFLYRLYDGKEVFYGFPVGKGDYKKAIELLIDDASERNVAFKMFGVTEQMKSIIDKVMPGKFEFELQRDMSDYIYNSSDLSSLKGKKYHGKRNHISRFERLYNWKYKNIGIDDLEDCKKFFEKWFSLNEDKNINAEKIALQRALDNYSDLKLLGGYLRVDGEIVAITIGEEINHEVFDIHFEKALVEYSGAYSTINQKFVQANLTNYKYVNREEDMGIEGLRKSKLSYNPVFLLDRYNAYLR